MGGFLIVKDARGKRMVPLKDGEWTLGRAIDNTIALADDKSSRRHCKLLIRGAQVTAIDNNSLNGTQVNGETITERQLRFGDKITIGNSEIILQMDEEELHETRNVAALDTPARPAVEETVFTSDATVYDQVTPHHPPLDELDRLRQENTSLQEILAIGRALATEQDTRRLTLHLVDTAIRLTGAERGVLCVMVNKQVRFELARDGLRRDLADPQSQVSTSVLRKCLETGTTLRLEDAQGEGEFSEVRSVRDLSLRSVLCVPLLIGQRTIGALYLDNAYDRNVFADWEVRLVEAFCGQASVALHNQRLIAENRQRAADLAEKVEEIETLRRDMEDRFEKTSARLQSAEELLRSNTGQTARFGKTDIIGRSRAMQEVFALIERVGDRDMPVLIQGENGTGKELIAKAIHAQSKRRQKPIVSLNCAAFPRELFESELFGHVKGAFTGADRDKMGLMEAASGSTLFLDEIGELPLEMQAKLLRVLQDHKIRRVGGNKELEVDFRLICATNAKLDELVAQKRFREDLLYRIKVIPITVPPLRERAEDIPLFIHHALEEEARKNKEPKREIDAEAMDLLSHYSWPGNVRQLQSVIQRMVLMSPDRLSANSLPPEMREKKTAAAAHRLAEGQTLKDVVEGIERTIIIDVLSRTEGNKTKAADVLGLSRLGLRKKMDRYQISE